MQNTLQLRVGKLGASRTTFILTPFAVALLQSAYAAPAENTNATTKQLKAVEIIGSQGRVRDLPGSGAIVEQSLEQTQATDIHQALKVVPGVYVSEEDGEGLRPNIGIRGATSERSEKITLLEDGVLAAPAPYSNPAAYYFPTALRMERIEVIKGAPLLRYGPQTTGGVVNLLTPSLPLQNSHGAIELELDERGGTDFFGYYGEKTMLDENNALLWQFETAQRSSPGFKSIDSLDRTSNQTSTQDSGFQLTDYVLKLGWQGVRQSVTLKTQYSEETSNETYLGLTDTDFNANPNRRYGLSNIDQMNNHHAGISLQHTIDWNYNWSQETQVYHQRFSRDWFKLAGGGDLIDAANQGDANAQGILDGTIDTSDLEYKHNNRDYISEGISTRVNLTMGDHLLQAGVRLHQDEMDRFQPAEIYDQVGGALVFQENVAATGGDNRLESAEAVSFWLTDDWQLNDRVNTQLLLRHEAVESSQIQYATVDRTEAGSVESTRSNDSAELLPGASITFDVNEKIQLLAGVHRGFSPLGGGAQAFEEPETSVNYEAGMRFRNEQWFTEIIGFYSDFNNKAENCSVGAPCTNGDTSGRFITGEATIAGLELQTAAQIQFSGFALPIGASYTYTQAELDQADISGLAAGDQLKDVPEHLLRLQTGYEAGNGWNTYVIGNYIDELCATTGCNRTSDSLSRTEDFWTVDLITHIPLQPDLELFVKAANVFDQQAIVSRSPDGARPNLPLTLSMGVNIAL